MTLLQRHLMFGLWSVSLFLLTAPVIRELIEFSLSDRMVASQIVVVPFVSAGLIFLRRREVFRVVENGMLAGATTIGLGLAVLSLPVFGGGGNPDRLSLLTGGLLVAWVGGFLFFYGAPAFRRAVFPLLFLAFSVPIPSAVLDGTIAFLQRASADTAYGLLKLTGTPVYREGFVFALPGLLIEVAPECSGIRSGIAMLMTSLLGGYLMLSSWWKRAALVLAALPLLILKNAIRIDTLSLLSIHVDPGFIEGRLHQEGGVVFFALGLLMLYPVLLVLMKSEGNQRLRVPDLPVGWSPPSDDKVVTR